MKEGTFVTDPPLSALLQKHRLGTLQAINCVKIGKILDFDAVKRTASVQIVFSRRLPNGDIKDYPPLKLCPVVTLQGGGGVLTFPVLPGDECLVLFSDSNIDAWYESGAVTLPYDGRRHDVSDAIVLVGLNSQVNHLAPAVTAGEVALTYSGSKIAEKNGKINLSNASGSFITVMDTFLTALAASTVLDTTTKTAATTLKTQLDLLFYL